MLNDVGHVIRSDETGIEKKKNSKLCEKIADVVVN